MPQLIVENGDTKKVWVPKVQENKQSIEHKDKSSGKPWMLIKKDFKKSQKGGKGAKQVDSSLPLTTSNTFHVLVG